MKDAAAGGAEDVAEFLTGLLDALQGNVFLCDADLKIVAINAYARRGLRGMSDEIREGFGVDAEQFVGLAFSRFVREPARLEAILHDPALLPHDAEVAIGSRIFQARIDALRTPQGLISGYAVVCEDLTRLRVAELELRAALLQRETLQREVHRRVKASLQMIAGLVRLENEASAGTTRDPAWAARLGSILRVHELIYAGADVSRVDLDAYVGELVRGLVAEHAAPGATIKVETVVGGEIRNLDILVSFGLVLGELVVNSVKHAFPGGRAGCIRVTARAVGGSLEGVVSDDGVGLPPGVASRAGFGLKLVSALIEGELKGDLRIESRGGGMACLFSIPAAASGRG